MQDFWQVALNFSIPWEPDGIKESSDPLNENAEEYTFTCLEDLDELDPNQRLEVWGFEL